MVEVIVRERVGVSKKGIETWKVQKVFSRFFGFLGNDIQVSFNDDMRLVVRFRESKHSDEEILVVFSMAETKRIIRFVKEFLRDDI